MKKSILSSVVLILVLVCMQIAVTSSDVSSYDIMADVNRDGMIDASDLARLGTAYGSRLILPSEPNKTVVTVLSFGEESPEVENARVAIFDLSIVEWRAIAINSTDSSGVTTFELSASTDYTAVAWSNNGLAYNFANFSTDSTGEACVLILLGEPLLPPIRALPQGWVVITLLQNGTNNLYTPSEWVKVYLDKLGWNPNDGWHANLTSGFLTRGAVSKVRPEGLPTNPYVNKPYIGIGVTVRDLELQLLGVSAYSSDMNGCANVIVYVTPP